MKKKSIISIAALALIALLLVGVYVFISLRPDRLHAWARIQWRDRALERVAERSSPEWVDGEIARMKAHPRPGSVEGETNSWFSKHLIVMRNGEWIVYDQICSKQDWRIHDIFIGRASDGRWYYSTFHFCRGMCVLSMMGRPPELAAFVKAYDVAEFDGKSDACLEETWDGMLDDDYGE
ncbi:MAG: hypothetical protein ACYS9X_10960 [Planctomycetota bacterium]|jgi:hypothetical protein